MRSGRGIKGRTSTVVFLATLTFLFVLLVSGAAMAAPPWSDAPNSWWQSTYSLTETQAATVADGYSDGMFRPGLNVTRAQFAKMVVEGFGLETALPVTATFPDVPKTNYFYAWIEGAVDAGVIGGFTDGKYRPDNNIIRQQANSILGLYLAGRELNLRGHIAGDLGNYSSLNDWYAAEGNAILVEFADRTSLAAVHAPSTAYLVYHGVVEGSLSGAARYLGPSQNLTRAQAVALILRTKSVTFSTTLPAITVLTPSSGPASGGNTVIITGANFTSATVVEFGTKDALSFTVNSSVQITAVAPSGTAGTTVDVKVTTPAGTSATSAATKYTYGLPSVTLLSPAAGAAAGGNTVVITGANFTGATAVMFGSSNVTSYVVNSSTQITAVAPPGSAGTTVDVRVSTAAGTSSTSDASKYSYGIPVVTLLDPAAGPAAGGTEVDIYGTGFTGVSGADAVKFGVKNAISFEVVSATHIEAIAPSGTGGTTVDVTVKNPVGYSAATGTANDYAYGVPAVTALLPNSGPATGGTTVTITGTGFVPGATVQFGGAGYPATNVTVASPTSITCISPAHSVGKVEVTVTTPAGVSSTEGTGNDFSYGIPAVTALSPNGGSVSGGTTVTITGTNFTSPATVSFGGTPATSVTVVNSTTITCLSPLHSTEVVDVTVTTGAGTSATDGAGNDFAYGAPTVTALSPTAGPVGGGTAVTITGTGFVPGASVSFGGTTATNVVVVGRTSITCVAPARLAGGLVDVIVTTTGGSSSPSGSANDYQYGSLHLVVTGIDDPATAGTASGMTVTVLDQSNNVVTSYVGTIHFTSTDSQAVLPSNYTFTLADAGTKAFPGGVTLKTAGSMTVTATDVANPIIVGSQIVTVNPAAAHHLDFGQEPTSTVAGVAISPSVTVRIEDEFGNLVDDDSTQVTVAIGTNPGSGTLSGTTLQTASNGIATFAGLSINKSGTGYTLTASASGVTGDTSSAFNIAPGAAVKLAFVQQPTEAVAGQAITPAVTVRVLDVNDNLVTAGTVSVAIAIGTNPGTGTLSGTLTVVAVSGVATFSDLSINQAGTGYTLQATASGLTTATSSAFNITAAP